tara:strand:+ start:4350 stop:4796 length:447 start_codon:yes stop_codon:yes gene_type:complete
MSGVVSSAGSFCAHARQINNYMSIKSTIAAVAASPFLFAGAAFAGPYVNVESNISYPDGEYSAATTDLHIGVEGSLSEKVSGYAQGGPSFVAVDGTDGAETEFSGKVGLAYAATESFGVYGELSGITDEVAGEDQVNWGAKLGGKFTF